MTSQSDIGDARDICLLLRSHGEQRWLISQVMPVLRQLEQPGSIPDDQLGAAYAYLEVLWFDARRRAAEADAARSELARIDIGRDSVLYEAARSYHAAVRRLRNAVGHRVAQLTHPAAEPGRHEHARL